MSGPFNVGRDSNEIAPGDGADYAGGGADSHTGVFEEAFDAQLPGDPHPGADLPSAGRFTYPYLRGPGGALADD